MKAQKRKMMIAACTIASLILIFGCTPVFAEPSGNELIRTSFQSLLDIVVAIVSSIGAILILWGIFDFATSLQSQDGAMQSNSFKRIGGGLVAVLGPQLLSLWIGSQ